jgi:hypothetical protein
VSQSGSVVGAIKRGSLVESSMVSNRYIPSSASSSVIRTDF